MLNSDYAKERLFSNKTNKIISFIEPLKNKFVYIYGAASMGKYALKALSFYNSDIDIHGFLISGEPEPSGLVKCGLPVVSIKDFDCCNTNDIAIVVALNQKYYTYVEREIKDININNIYYFMDIFTDIVEDMFARNGGV